MFSSVKLAAMMQYAAFGVGDSSGGLAQGGILDIADKEESRL